MVTLDNVKFIMNNPKSVWLFQGEQARFASAVFSDRAKATAWIASNDASGILTEYPMDISVYDWAVENEFFVPKKEHHQTSAFKQNFTSASQAHYHFKNGVEVG